MQLQVAQNRFNAGFRFLIITELHIFPRKLMVTVKVKTVKKAAEFSFGEYLIDISALLMQVHLFLYGFCVLCQMVQEFECFFEVKPNILQDILFQLVSLHEEVNKSFPGGKLIRKLMIKIKGFCVQRGDA